MLVRLRVVSALAYLAVTIYFGTVPSRGLPGMDKDKLLHALCFFGMVVITFPAAVALDRRWPGLRERADWLCACYAIAVGGLLEVVQAVLPSRRADLLDFAADGVGAVLGLLVLKGVRAWRRQVPS